MINAWRRYPVTAAVVVFLAGLVIGLTVFGWWLWPVAWTNAGIQHTTDFEQERWVVMTADLYAFDRRAEMARWRLTGWEWAGDEVACRLARQTTDLAQRARLTAAAYAVNGKGCMDDDVR